jgi:hypothetical protein
MSCAITIYLQHLAQRTPPKNSSKQIVRGAGEWYNNEPALIEDINLRYRDFYAPSFFSATHSRYPMMSECAYNLVKNPKYLSPSQAALCYGLHNIGYPNETQ